MECKVNKQWFQLLSMRRLALAATLLAKGPTRITKVCMPTLATCAAVLFFGLFAARPMAAQNYIFVTTIADKISATGGCSLKEAIYSSNLHTTFDGIHGIAIDRTDPVHSDHFITTECLNGTGNDIIVLPFGAVFCMDKVTADAYNFMGPTATPMIISHITFQANGSTLLWTGAGYARAFAVGTADFISIPGHEPASGTGFLTIQHAYIKGFKVKGGNGAEGAGGGMGAGGAVFVKDGSLIIENSTFDSNAAIGGNGGGSNGSGGGGGLGGNGGSPGGDNFFISGGGGGGSSSNGFQPPSLVNVGGDGGGTVVANYACGGNGGGNLNGGDGSPGRCPGGGGGGGQAGPGPFDSAGGGGNGNYGGGGGGGADATGSGGDGGFGGGGGGGAGEDCILNPGASGGNGGFGGGGGSGWECLLIGGPGKGGTFAGRADTSHGGGGGALGGAIFNDGGGIRILNSTFTRNSVYRGNSGGGKADNGADAGGAIFSLNGHTTINNATISGNHSTGSQGGVVVMQDSCCSDTIFVLENTIISGNGPKECSIIGSSIGESFAGNLIQQNDNCQGVVTSLDPQLGPLENNQGNTPTMAIPRTSPAFNAADPGTSLPTDQRGQVRPAQNMGGVPDIGAFELCLMGRFPLQFPCTILAGNEPTEPLTVNVSPAAGGTTTPAPGNYNEPLDSVVVLGAESAAGYAFHSWTGLNVIDPTSPCASIVLDNPQSVTANFVPSSVAADVSRLVGISRGSIVLNHATGRDDETVTLTNTSCVTISGPISLVLDHLTNGVALFNATGHTGAVPPAGSPYLNSSPNLASGQSVSLTLEFTDPAKTGIGYTTRVLAGPGYR